MMSESESQDYNAKEVELVKQFYSDAPNDNYFRDFFFPQNISPGIWVKKFITNLDPLPPRLSVVEENTFAATGIDEKILFGAIEYGGHTSINLVSKTDPSALETFQVVIDWLEPNIAAGYNVHKSVNANVYRSQDAAENIFDVVFDKELGVVGGRSAIRLEAKYDLNAPRYYNADGDTFERVPSSMHLFFGGKKMAEFGLVGYVLETAENIPTQLLAKKQLPVGSKAFSSTGLVSKFMCGLKKGGTLFGIGQKEEFELFTSEQQIRAAVVLHVAKLFCYASSWRVYFGFLNSLGTAIAFEVKNIYRANRLYDTANNIAQFLGFSLTNIVRENEEVTDDGYSDNYGMNSEDVKAHMRNQFAGWNDDPLRVINTIVQANRIQAHLFQPTETYQAYLLEKKKNLVEDKNDISNEVQAYIDLVVENVYLSQAVANQLTVSEDEKEPLRQFLADFNNNFQWTSMNNEAWSVERVKQQIFLTAEKIRLRTQKTIDQSLRFVIKPNASPLYQFLVRLLVCQQLLKGAAFLTDAMVRFGVGREQQTITAPLRATERAVALFAARTLLESIPIEKRTSGGKTESFAAELQKIVASGGGNGQVPVPDMAVLELMFEPLNEMQLDQARTITIEDMLFGFNEFYRQERFYFSDIVRIPWTTTVLDDVLFRFDILSNDDKQYALLTLQVDSESLKSVLANTLDTANADQRVADSLVASFMKVPEKIAALLSEAYNLLSLPVSQNTPNQTLKIVVLLQSAKTNIAHYFSAVEVLETRSKISENVRRYNLMIQIEKGVAEVLRLYKVNLELPDRAQKLDTNINPLLDEILGEENEDRMQVGERFNALPIGLLDEKLAKPVRSLLTDYANELKNITKIDDAKNTWKKRKEQFERDQAAVMEKEKYDLAFRQVTWLLQLYANDENREQQSPFDQTEIGIDPSTEEERNDLDTAQSLEKELESVAKALERVYIADVVRQQLTKITLTSKGTELVGDVRNGNRDVLQFEESKTLLESIAQMFEIGETMARNTKKFFATFNDKNKTLAEKSGTLTREFAPIQQDFQKIMLLKKDQFSKYALDFLLVNKLGDVMSSVESVMKSLRASLKPDELQKLDSVAKQIELDRLTEVNKQLVDIKGKLKDSFEELQRAVQKAETVDKESRKYDEKLGKFSLEATNLVKRIQSFSAIADEANKALVNLGNIDELAETIEFAKQEIPKLDDERRRLIELMPVVSRDLVKVQKQIDDALADAKAAENVLEKLKPKADDIEKKQQEANRKYEETNAKISALIGKIDNTRKATEASLQQIANVEKTIDTTLGTLKIRSAEIEKKETESEKIVDNARSVLAKVNRNDVDVKTIDQQIARLIIASQRDTNDYDTLSQKIDVVFRNVNDIITAKGERELAKSIVKAIDLQIAKNNELFFNAAFEQKVQELVDQRILEIIKRQQGEAPNPNQNIDDDNPVPQQQQHLQTVVKQEPPSTPVPSPSPKKQQTPPQQQQPQKVPPPAPQQQPQQFPPVPQNRPRKTKLPPGLDERQKILLTSKISELEESFRTTQNDQLSYMATVLKVIRGDYWRRKTSQEQDAIVNNSYKELTKDSLKNLLQFLESLQSDSTAEYTSTIRDILEGRPIEKKLPSSKVSANVGSFDDCLRLLVATEI